MTTVSKLKPLPLLLIGLYLMVVPALKLSFAANMLIIHVILAFSIYVLLKTRKDLQPKSLYIAGTVVVYVSLISYLYFM